MSNLEEADFESDGGDDVDEVEDVISFQPIERVSRYGRKSTALRRYNDINYFFEGCCVVRTCCNRQGVNHSFFARKKIAVWAISWHAQIW
jgi:hypothetical protein